MGRIFVRIKTSLKFLAASSFWRLFFIYFFSYIYAINVLIKRNKTMRYYGVRQMCHGADHVFVFSEDEMKEAIKDTYIKEDYLPKTTDEGKEIGLFPWGGSNVSEGFAELLEDEEAAYDYLTQQDAMGPDSEDPCLVDMAEYYWKIEVHDGCAGEILAKHGVTAEEVEKEVSGSHDVRISDIVDTLGNINFYSDEYRDVRLSDVYLIKGIKDALASADTHWDYCSRDAYHSEALVRLPRPLAFYLLSINGFNPWRADKDMAENTLLHIKKNEESVSWSIYENLKGNTFDDKLSYENNGFVRDQISKIVTDAVEKIEQKDEVER